MLHISQSLAHNIASLVINRNRLSSRTPNIARTRTRAGMALPSVDSVPMAGSTRDLPANSCLPVTQAVRLTLSRQQRGPSRTYGHEFRPVLASA